MTRDESVTTVRHVTFRLGQHEVERMVRSHMEQLGNIPLGAQVGYSWLTGDLELWFTKEITVNESLPD